MTNKFYLDLEVIDSIPFAYKKNSQEILQLSGQNIGNLAFRSALKHILPNLNSYSIGSYTTITNALSQGKKIDSILISCANWLGFSEQDEKSNGYRFSVLERSNARLIPIGLGIQSATADLNLEFGPNTKKLIKLFSERSEVISVRDSYTKDMLKKEGILNVLVTGCPSNFLNQSNDFIDTLKKNAQRNLKLNNSHQPLKSLISEFAGGNKFSGAILKSHLDFLEKNTSFYALQAPSLLPFYLKENRELDPAYLSNKPDHLSQLELTKILLQKIVWFNSIDSWMDFARTCDFCFGMRIHGSIVPLQATVPSILISHDSRTAGLADAMSFPSVTAEEFSNIKQTEVTSFINEKFLLSLDNYAEKREKLKFTFNTFFKESLGLNNVL